MPEPEPQEPTNVSLELPAFGMIEPNRVLSKDDLFAVVKDKYPVSPGHTLIIPRRAGTRPARLSATSKSNP